MEIETEHIHESLWLPSSQIFHPYDWAELFGSTAPMEVELGSGDGTFIVERAKASPDHHFLAVERLMGRARKIIRKLKREELTNVKVLRLESFYVLSRLCPLNSLDRVWILFPDPWPKAKHHRRRLIQPDFLEAAHLALKPEGMVCFGTDHEEYFHWAKEVWEEQPNWNESDAWDWSLDPVTDFQRGFEAEGRSVHRMCWTPGGKN